MGIAAARELAAQKLIKKLKVYNMQNSSEKHVSTGGSNTLLADVNINDATHLLLCKHCIGTRCMEYTMHCKLIGVTKNGLCKIIVFGERNWKDRDHIKRIRYVTADRLVAYGG